ncbi:MAG: hypothetical protein J6U54_03915 [Clostridiales bacterium]|nr:hypothetical protein [Clostridiales bacterium]
MYLRFSKSLKDSVLTVNLSLIGNTTEETRAIRQLGAPQIKLLKDYPTSGTAVDIDLPVTEFVASVVFNGTPDTLQDVIAEGEEFILDIKEGLTEAMTDLIRQYRAVKATVEKTSGSILIYSGASDIAEE